MTITPEKKEPEKKVESAPLVPPLADPQQPRGPFTSYKEDQGRHVRMAAFWSCVFFLGFGCRFLHDILIQWPQLRAPISGWRIPIVGVDVSPAFLVNALIFCAGIVLIQRWQQKPKVADLLIETENELKKVTWPKGDEVWNAAMVVLLSVIIIGLMLAFADVLLYRLLIRYLILREG